MFHSIKKISSNKGQTIVETAVILPIILLLVFGIIEFGRIFNGYIIISNASREGARYAAVGHTGAEVRQIVLDKTASLGVVTVSISPFDERTQGNKVDVNVSYDLPLVAPIIRTIISTSNTYHIESSTSMCIE